MDIGALDRADLLQNDKLKLIILTEDDDQIPIRTIIASSEIPMEEIEIWSYKGCSDVKTANVLSAYILKNSPNVKIVIHRDRDYNNDEEVQKIIDDYHDNITYHFITDGTDVESHLLNPKHLSFVHPELTEDKAEELINKSIEDSFIKSRRKYVNSLTDKSLKNKSGHKAADNVELAEENLRGNPKKYSHGKIVVGDLKSKIQQEIKKNPNLFSPSPYIASPIFDKIKSDLWE